MQIEDIKIMKMGKMVSCLESGVSGVVGTERKFVPRQSNFNFVLQRQSNFVSPVVPVCPLVIVPASYIAKLSPSLPSLCITCICDKNVAAEYIPGKMMICDSDQKYCALWSSLMLTHSTGDL